MKTCVWGDSITLASYINNSWFHLLKNSLEIRLKEELEIYNLGINADTSDNIIYRFKIEASARNPNKIIFAIGVNDSSYIYKTNMPLVTEINFRNNLSNLYVLGSQYTSDITFIGLVLGDDSILKPYPGSSKGKSYSHIRVQKYDEIIRKFCISNKCKYIYLYDKLDYDDFIDGLHPNENGHRKMFDEIIKHI